MSVACGGENGASEFGAGTDSGMVTGGPAWTGAADVSGTSADSASSTPEDEPTTALAEGLSFARDLPFDHYARAAHFMDFVLDEFGPAATTRMLLACPRVALLWNVAARCRPGLRISDGSRRVERFRVRTLHRGLPRCYDELDPNGYAG